MINSDIKLNLKIYKERYKKQNQIDRYEPFIEIIAKLIKKYNKKNILDFACGQGRLGYFLKTKYLQKYKFTLDGVEITKECLKTADKYYNNIHIRNDYKLPRKKYDFIALISIIEHINPQNLDILFADINKKISKNGLLFIVVPNFNSPNRFFSKNQKLKEEKTKLGHINLISRKQINELLLKYNFQKIKYSFFCKYKDLNLIDFNVPKVSYYLTSFFPFYFLRSSFWILAGKK